MEPSAEPPLTRPLLVAPLGGAYDRLSGYVYLLASRLYGVVYVGETNNRGGAVGRAGEHLQPGGTFTGRFEDAVGLQVEAATDLALVAARLPSTPEFTGVERSYRQGVEYLVHSGLLAHPARTVHRFRLIAQVAYSPRTAEPSVQRLADDIVAGFVDLYPTIA